MKIGNKASLIGKWLRAGMVFSILAVGVALFAAGGKSIEGTTTAQSQAWGSESLADLRSGLDMISPIALANACGMGASSCFKCHNGKRASAPNMDAAKAPWHAQHKKVNNSCVGCHKGNPRLMKEDMAHAGMLKGPRAGADACGDCHKSDLAKLEAVYQSVTGRSK
ncbi:MAG: cytochrome c3 family protein [Pseudomonadota bacterium]|nr:cytochrome c3 family protein [Pseudomonadota bacterium]MDP1906034.1 cytochrome c3 family protein [Pseudomonadota bacterium]MDP2352504.1 cytochrome c3 family protein [Pseudomonadota bacterium]